MVPKISKHCRWRDRATSKRARRRNLPKIYKKNGFFKSPGNEFAWCGKCSRTPGEYFLRYLEAPDSHI